MFVMDAAKLAFSYIIPYNIFTLIFQRAQEDDRLVIFVGSGVSKNSGVSSQWKLIKKFEDELGYPLVTLLE